MNFKRVLALRQLSWFHLIFWCRNFVEVHSFRRVSGDWLETLRKLCTTTKFLHRKLGKISVFYAVLAILYFIMVEKRQTYHSVFVKHFLPKWNTLNWFDFAEHDQKSQINNEKGKQISHRDSMVKNDEVTHLKITFLITYIKILKI